MKNVVNVVVRIEYEATDSSYTNEEKDLTAIHLAVNPKMHTVESGVSIDSVHLSVIDEQQLIDWDKLKHSPDEEIKLN